MLTQEGREEVVALLGAIRRQYDGMSGVVITTSHLLSLSYRDDGGRAAMLAATVDPDGFHLARRMFGVETRVGETAWVCLVLVKVKDSNDPLYLTATITNADWEEARAGTRTFMAELRAALA